MNDHRTDLLSASILHTIHLLCTSVQKSKLRRAPWNVMKILKSLSHWNHWNNRSHNTTPHWQQCWSMLEYAEYRKEGSQTGCKEIEFDGTQHFCFACAAGGLLSVLHHLEVSIQNWYNISQRVVLEQSLFMVCIISATTFSCRWSAHSWNVSLLTSEGRFP